MLFCTITQTVFFVSMFFCTSTLTVLFEGTLCMQEDRVQEVPRKRAASQRSLPFTVGTRAVQTTIMVEFICLTFEPIPDRLGKFSE